MQTAVTMSPATCFASTSGRCSAVLDLSAHVSTDAHWENFNISNYCNLRFASYLRRAVPEDVEIVLQMQNTVQSESRHLEALNTPQVTQMSLKSP